MLGPRVPYLNAIGPINTTGSGSRISFDISKALYLDRLFQFRRNLNSNIFIHSYWLLTWSHKVYLHGRTVTPLTSSKQTLVTTPTIHSVMLHVNMCGFRMINHILHSCGNGSLEPSTIIYTDNVACVAQMQMGYIKSNITKHIDPKLFYLYEL